MENQERQIMPEQNFAGLGGGKIAYVRTIKSQDAKALFPGLPAVAPDLDLFALLAADGTPIMLADTREAIEVNARENDLETVSIH
jgi:hypothetical protein